MTLKDQVLALPIELQAGLHQLIEDRLIEIGAMKDPYGLSEAQLRAIDQQLAEKEKETDGGDTATTNNADDDHWQKEWAAEHPGESYEAFLRQQQQDGLLYETVAAQVAECGKRELLFELYEITQQAIAKEEEQYEASMQISAGDWLKMNMGRDL